MDIKYNVKTFKNNVMVEDIDIDLENTLFSGQAFRWVEFKQGFKGVVNSKEIYAYKENKALIFEDVEEDFFIRHLAHYFDLYKDYHQILKSFGFDDILDKSLTFAPGIRVLNQPPFETTISFIISANNNIKRIRLIIGNLCKNYGIKHSGKYGEYAAFPSPQALASASIEDLYACGAGYRAPYIKQTAMQINDGFNLDKLKDKPYLEARKALISLKGVGNKVADCILLYSLGFSNAFPLDVWIKRVVHNLYGFKSTKDADILRFVDKKFGSYAGIAQQYLFYYVKQNKLGIK